MSFEIKIVFDNKCPKEGFLTGFGFSSLIFNHFSNSYLLFDTGGNSEVLIHNIKKFKINVSEIKKVIISHNHHDHAAGLMGIYKLNPNIEIYVPKDNIISFKRVFPEATIYGVLEPTEIEKNVYSSGQLGDTIKEQALFLKTKNNEIVIVVGCTHPGLEYFIIQAKKINDIKAIIGGFHGFRKYSYLEGIDFIGACHCTAKLGDLLNRFPNQLKKICVGTSLIF